jgi:DNA-binding GntR family transcriptional regulator
VNDGRLKETGMTIEQIQSPDRVTDATYQKLRQALLDGTLAPGTKLSVPALAAQLGVSRSPVREAVLRLIQEGLAVEVARRGAVVRRLSAADLIPVYEVREVLEGLAARLAAQRCTAPDASELAETMRAHESAVAEGDLQRHVALDMEFHRQLRAIADNAELAQALETVQGKILVGMKSTSVSGGPAAAVADHRRICDAVTAHDQDRAEQEARRHIARLRARLATQ